MSLTASGMIDRASAEISKCIMRIKRKDNKKPPEVPPKPTNPDNNILRNGVPVLPTLRTTTTTNTIGGINSILPSTVGPSTIPTQLTPMTPRKFATRKTTSKIKQLPTSAEELWKDEGFLRQFFLNYFQGTEKLVLPGVCRKWRDVSYHCPEYWMDLIPVLKCKELRRTVRVDGGLGAGVRRRFYAGLVKRGFNSLKLDSATDEDAEDVLIHFSQGTQLIQTLKLSSSSISDKGLYNLIDHLTSLKELQLSSCNELSEDGIIQALPKKLEKLVIYDCIHVADVVVSYIAKSLNLTQFSLQAYHVTDTALMSFNQKTSSNLTSLKLDSCWELTNQTILHIVSGLPTLRRLSLSGCSKITDEGIEILAENLTHLRSLDLSWGPRITDASLECIACDLMCLEELILDRCTMISDLGVGYLATMSTLRKLSLRWCSIRDASVHHVVGMRRLQFLSLAGCVNISPSTFCSLSNLRNLRELELTNCGANPQVLHFLRTTLHSCVVVE